jgi:primase-polymerase (primpol)-like protein
VQYQAINNQEPHWLKPKFNNIPEELKQQPWAVWRAEPRDGSVGKYHKAPCSPSTGRKIGTDKPELFGTFDEAVEAYKSGEWTGIGVLMTGNQIVGIDIDDAIKLFDEKPEIKTWVDDALNAGVYCEISPSGTGFRLFTLGTLPSKGRKYKGLEIYANVRFLSVTGHTLFRKVKK